MQDGTDIFKEIFNIKIYKTKQNGIDWKISKIEDDINKKLEEY